MKVVLFFMLPTVQTAKLKDNQKSSHTNYKSNHSETDIENGPTMATL
jgi:hypothetical protein